MGRRARQRDDRRSSGVRLGRRPRARARASSEQLSARHLLFVDLDNSPGTAILASHRPQFCTIRGMPEQPRTALWRYIHKGRLRWAMPNLIIEETAERVAALIL